MNQRKVIAALFDGARVNSPNGVVEIETAEAGTLDLPTGRVIACDPGMLTENGSLTPLARTISPGRYPVQISIAKFAAGGRRVAFATVRLGASPPVRFEPAMREGDDPSSFKDGETPAHGVDSGTSCFIDVRAAEELVRRNADWDYRWNGFGALIGFSQNEEWKNVAVDPQAGLNLVEFSSGFGDGRYTSYWGFDSEDRVACLLTDFGLLGGPGCLSCGAEVGQPHHFLCDQELCPFCGGQINGCGCMVRVLELGQDEADLIHRFDALFNAPAAPSGFLGWLASKFKKPRLAPLSQEEEAKVRAIHGRWKKAADAKGRIPFGPPGTRVDECGTDDYEQPAEERRTFLVMMGTVKLGRFSLPVQRVGPAEGGVRPTAGGQDAVRVCRLVQPPSWSQDRGILVWSERREGDVASMMWRPRSEEDRAEAERFYEAARVRSWKTPDDLRALLSGPGPWLIRLNMFGTLKYLTENREEVLFAPDSDDDGPETLADEPAKAATFTSEQALAFIPRLGKEWLQDDEDYYFEPVRPADVR
jgi:Protein of unknown function (DUF4241)